MPQKRVFKPSQNEPINEKLDSLESVRSKVDEIKKEEARIVKQIREGFVDSVVVFIDLVDSTKFKIENQNEPEKWILRVKQFSEIIKEFIENSNGKIVKYIGDEVMGIFDQRTQIEDALGLIIRIQQIEQSLTEITGSPTQVKISLDYGKVFLLKYEGHNELDPQGTPIDRCARIGKYCSPSTVLSSYDFVSKCSFPKQWTKIGIAEMKGLGSQPVYQFGDQSIEISKKIEIAESDLNKLKEDNSKLREENQNLTIDKKELISTISELQKQLQQAGEEPVITTDFSEESEQEQEELDYEEIMSNIRKIKKLIHEAGVNEREYGRFLFLNEKGYAENYNKFEGKTFDASIEKGLVKENSDQQFELNHDNKRNKAVTKLIDETERLLRQYVSSYGSLSEKDLFDYSFSDADFWKKYLDIPVTY